MSRLAVLSVSSALSILLLGGAGIFTMPRADSPGPDHTRLPRQAACFVPNLGQWSHQARFVHRSGPMSLFLEDRGFVLDVASAKRRAVALRMTFEGAGRLPEIVGEEQRPGHHNYFLGRDASRWRTGVPLFGAVRYEELYPGIDLRLRHVGGVPEYDLLLQPGADLSSVTVHVEGGKSLSIADDGALVIETELGPLTQPRPGTWQVGPDGTRHAVACSFVLLGRDRFGFRVAGWDRDTSLVIDPALIWSTFFGGSGGDQGFEMFVDARGVVTVAGITNSGNLPTTTGAYDRTLNNYDGFVSRLDPGRTGSAQLLYSTFLGGSANDYVTRLSVDPAGVVTLAGWTQSTDLPTTGGAYDTTRNSSGSYAVDAFVSRLDPNKTGSAQLAYSTYLGEISWVSDYRFISLSVDASGVVTAAGTAASSSFPTTSGAYDTTFNSGDGFVSRLDPRKTGSAQLVYSTFLGGSRAEEVGAVFVDGSGVVTVAGTTGSSNFPTTAGAFNRTSTAIDAFISRLDPSKTGKAQLVYSTLLATSSWINALSVDSTGIITAAGGTRSPGFPTTPGAYDRTHSAPATFPVEYDGFISQLDPAKTGAAQLVYSTFLGGSSALLGGGRNGYDDIYQLFVDPNGVITVAGRTDTFRFPTTNGAYDNTYNGYMYDGFVSRLDPRQTGSAQLVYSTFLGGEAIDEIHGLSVDPSGTAFVAGYTASYNFPTTQGAYDTTHNLVSDVFVSRLSMGVPFYADVHEVSLSAGGTQKLTLEAGKAHANRSYWIFGSVTGTTPGVTLGSPAGAVNIPLNPDVWTNYTIAFANSAILTNTKGTLDASGQAQASINILKTSMSSGIGLVFYHAYVVYDANNNYYLASNPVPLKLVR